MTVFSKGLLYVLFILFNCSLFGQTVISGSIKDGETELPMVGASILIEGTIEGTVTDLDGYFSLITKQVPPFTLKFSFIGYESRRVEILTSGQEINIKLDPKPAVGEEVVIAASRISEDMLRSPVTIEKLDGIELRTTPTPNVYGALANLRGVQMNTSSVTFTSVNTRGFADVQNWRFVQTVDGMEMNAPGLNYPVGTVSAPPDIDIASMELVPGAGSALYGANAFNGMLLINSKDPFMYQGLSVDLKGGITMQDAAGVNPFGMLELRYAKSINDKFAFKITASGLMVHDWAANDTSFHITNDIAAAGEQGLYSDLGRYQPGFDAVNIYGDESNTSSFIFLGDTSANIYRTGFRERDLVDYDQQLFKVGAALHYRISPKAEISYDYRLIQGDAVLRHSTIYPLVNFNQQIHKLALKGTHFGAKAYYSIEDAGDSYYILGLGDYLNESLKPSSVWAQEYGAAYRGEVTGVTAGDHQIARAYADRDIPDPDSEVFQNLLDSAKQNADFLSGGAKFVDRSRFAHVEGNYDFSEHWDVIPIQAGASFRQFWLNSEGSLFNDGENGYNGPIPIHEFGGYLQASKSLFEDRLALRASLRFDKNQNFAGRFTPRASMLVSMGKNRNHNIRASYQTGFRNPAMQESFVALDIQQAVLLGGLAQNLDNYIYTLPRPNFITGAAAGTTVDGNTIHDSLITVTSFGNFIRTGNIDTFELMNIPDLVQEKVATYELGYRSMIGDKLYIDAFGYYNTYKNFVTQVTGFSPQAGRAFLIYTNIEDEIWSIGAGLLVEYLLAGNYKISANYTYTTYSADEALANNPGFLPSFNTPEHRANLSVSNRNVWNNLGFSVKFRWSDSYVWQSPFGQGTIPAYTTLDAAVLYQLPKLGVNFKLGGTNLLMQEYQQLYGGPRVGSQIYVGITYDPSVYKNSVSTTNKKSKKKDTKKSNAGFGRF